MAASPKSDPPAGSRHLARDPRSSPGCVAALRRFGPAPDLVLWRQFVPGTGPAGRRASGLGCEDLRGSTRSGNGVASAVAVPWARLVVGAGRHGLPGAVHRAGEPGSTAGYHTARQLHDPVSRWRRLGLPRPGSPRFGDGAARLRGLCPTACAGFRSRPLACSRSSPRRGWRWRGERTVRPPQRSTVGSRKIGTEPPPLR